MGQFLPGARYQLSPFISIQPSTGCFTFESMLSGRSFPVTSPPVFQLLFAFASPSRPNDALRSAPPRQRSALLRFLERCHREQFLTEVDSEGGDDPKAHWEFHDLLFHVRSRRGRSLHPSGATYRGRGSLPPEPHVPADQPPSAIRLWHPDIERLRKNDVPFTRVLESRRSRYGGDALDCKTIGEFLFRTAAIRAVTHPTPDETLVRRVYPSGGGLHSLEIYLVACRCADLAPGVYHYRALEHSLGHVSGVTSDVEDLIRDAMTAAGGRLLQRPSVLFVITSRFRRVMWKYESLAYSLILKEVGALFQTMYLVATAMQLSPCALGSGDADRFSSISRRDYYREASVGEFILSGRSAPGRLNEETRHAESHV